MTAAVVDIDLNVRLGHCGTFAGFEAIHGRMPAIRSSVVVREPESGAIGTGRVTSIEWHRQLIYLDVDWSELQAPHQHDGPGGVCPCGAERCSLPSCDSHCVHPEGWLSPVEVLELRGPRPELLKRLGGPGTCP